MAQRRKNPYLPYPDGTGGDGSPYLKLAVPNADEDEEESPTIAQAMGTAGHDRYGIGGGTVSALAAGVGADQGGDLPLARPSETPYLGSVTGEAPTASAPESSTQSPYCGNTGQPMWAPEAPE